MGLMRLLCLALLAFAFAGCSQKAPPSDHITIHRGNGAEPDTLDPHKMSGTWENNIISDLMEGLMTIDAGANVIYGSAVSHTVSEDGLVYTFTLRDGLQWSDGVPVTADDFVFSLQRILDPTTVAQYASLLYPIKNAREVNEGRMTPDNVGIRAIDDKTVEITLENPTPYLPTLLTHQTTQPVPKHLVEKYGDDWVKPGKMVSNGPYVLAEWVPNGYVRAIKNPLYYDAEEVQIEEVYYYPISDASVELKRYQAGELDLTESLPIREIPTLKREIPNELHIVPYLASEYLQINVHKPPFDDVRVREALSLAVDREMIADVIMAAGEIPAYSFVPPGIANYKAGAELRFKSLTMDERRARARELLEAAGFGSGNPLKFPLRYRDGLDARRVMIATQDMFKQIGVEAELLNTETRVHYNALRSQDFEVSDAGWVADYNDAENYLFLMESTSGQMNYSKYANPEYDALMREAARTLDTQARADILMRAEQIILDDHVIVPVYFAAYRQLVKPYVGGFEDNVLKWHRTRYLRIDRGAG